MSHPEVHPGLLGDSGRLEAPPFERDRGALHAAPQRVGAAVGVAPRRLEQPIDHAGTAPPTSASSMRTCRAPSATPRGYCPPLPQPPPIGLLPTTPAMRSTR